MAVHRYAFPSVPVQWCPGTCHRLVWYVDFRGTSLLFLRGTLKIEAEGSSPVGMFTNVHGVMQLLYLILEASTRSFNPSNGHTTYHQLYIHSAVGSATSYPLDSSGFEAQWGARFSLPSRPVPRPTQPSVQGTRSFSGVERPQRGVDHKTHLASRLKED